MSTIDPDMATTLDRRGFLKLGVAGSVVLGVAGFGGSLAGCGQRERSAAAGLHYLRDADVSLLRAVAPVMLKGLLAEGMEREKQLAEVLRRIDDAGRCAGPPAQRELTQLFDLLHLRPTRWLTTGIGAPWAQADAAEIEQFLRRWRRSSVGLFNAGYNALNKLCCVGYFGQPAGWTQTGYPGPPAWAYQSLNQ